LHFTSLLFHFFQDNGGLYSPFSCKSEGDISYCRKISTFQQEMSKQTTLTATGPVIKPPSMTCNNGEIAYLNISGVKIGDALSNFLMFGEFIMEEQDKMPRNLLTKDLEGLVCASGQNVIFRCTLCKNKFKVNQKLDNRIRMDTSVLGHLHNVHGVVPFDHLPTFLQKAAYNKQISAAAAASAAAATSAAGVTSTMTCCGVACTGGWGNGAGSFAT
jgi:hypothetical protein